MIQGVNDTYELTHVDIPSTETERISKLVLIGEKSEIIYLHKSSFALIILCVF